MPLYNNTRGGNVKTTDMVLNQLKSS
jgi:hypothetical protein